MKKCLFSILFITVCLTLFSATSLAAFAGLARSTITATATTTGTGEVAMTVELRNCLNNSTTGFIYWSAVTLPVGWKVSDAYILLSSTITIAGGIQIYTNNLASEANPQYTGSATSKAGLIRTDNTTGKLPMGWLIVDTSTNSVVAGDPDVNASWFYFKDPGNTGGDTMTNGEDYVTVKSEDGIHWERTTWGAADSPDKILIEANFGAAVLGKTYRTSTLRLEAYTE